MNPLTSSLWQIYGGSSFGLHGIADRIDPLEVHSLQLNTDDNSITSIKYWCYAYLDKAHQNLVLGYAYLYVPTSSFAITDESITGESKVEKVYGIFSQNYHDILKCDKEWSDMQELDITCIFSSCVMDREYNCTISGDDGFQTLRPMLNKVAPMTVAREGDTVVFSSVSFSRIGTEGCPKAKSAPIWLIIVIAAVLVCILLCIIILIIKKRKSTPSLH